jgi:hypothetical protein
MLAEVVPIKTLCPSCENMIQETLSHKAIGFE